MQAEGNTVFAGGQTGTGVYRSLDYGTTWSLLTNGIASGTYRGFASNSNMIVAGSFTDGVFYSLDNGDNWTQINQGLLDLNVFDLELNNNYIIAGTHSKGVFRFPLSELSATSINDEFQTNQTRNLLKIADVLGRETMPKNNQVLFYIYDDGSVVKKHILNR